MKFMQSASDFFLFFRLTFSFRFQFNNRSHFFDVTRVEKIAVEFTIQRERESIKEDKSSVTLKPLSVSDCVCVQVNNGIARNEH